MLSNIGLPGLLVIFAIVLVIFGAKRLPEIAESMGKAIKKFRETQSDSNPDDPKN